MSVIYQRNNNVGLPFVIQVYATISRNSLHKKPHINSSFKDHSYILSNKFQHRQTFLYEIRYISFWFTELWVMHSSLHRKCAVSRMKMPAVRDSATSRWYNDHTALRFSRAQYRTFFGLYARSTNKLYNITRMHCPIFHIDELLYL